MPIIALGALRGTTLLAHTHDGHGSHLHISTSVADARRSAEQHRVSHASGDAACIDVDPAHPSHSPPAHTHPACSDPAHAHPIHTHHHDAPHEPCDQPPPEAPAEVPNELVITIPDHDQLTSRGVDLPPILQSPLPLECLFAALRAHDDVIEDVGSPGGGDAHQRTHPLSALTAGQRLVRTSKALLI